MFCLEFQSLKVLEFAFPSLGGELRHGEWGD